MHAKSQETLRILFVGLSTEESDFLLNQLKERGYNSRGNLVVSNEQLISNLEESCNWSLLVIDQDFNELTPDRVLKAISKRHLYIPIILLTATRDNIPYELLDNGIRAILAKQDKKYFANLVIKEIGDFNIRKNYFLMSVALNAIEHHTRNIINRVDSALVYTVRGIVYEVNNNFLKLIKLNDKKDIIGKSLIELLDKQESNYFAEFIENIETASEPVSVMQTVFAIENNSIPVNITILPTSLEGKFALCLEINKSSPTNQSKQRTKIKSTDALLVSSEQFKQNFNVALQRSLSDNKHSMLSCINLGELYKIIANSENNNSTDALNIIIKAIKKLVLKSTIITKLDNGYFMLLFNNSNKKVVKQNITDIIDKLNNLELDINNEIVKVSAFAGLVVISADSENPQEFIKYAKHASVVAYMNKSKAPELYQTSERQQKPSVYQFAVKSIKTNIENKKINFYYRGILNTKNNDVKIYRICSYMNIDQELRCDSDLEPQFSNIDIWGQLDKLKIIQVAKQITNNLANLDHVIVSIGINSIKNIKFVNWLDDLLIKFKIDTSYFIIEVNEYFVIKYKKDITRLFSELQSRGYNICIGKFGCSLSYKKVITQYDPNFICIDNSFIESIEQDNPEDIKQILDNIKSYDSAIIVPHIANLKIMQKILEFDVSLLSGDYIQPSYDTIKTDLR